MYTTNHIQNPRLHELVTQSARWAMLKPEDQQAQLTKMIHASDELINTKYIPFFEEENQRELQYLEAKKPEIYQLIEKITEMKRSLKIIALRDLEKQQTQIDQTEVDKLLNDINKS
ncbi:hypothetical protein CVV38_01135 [Candidatus Peregrinibacteria bacterium HGW-Peregrinibacteria-1]|jgi:TRAP-type C4-dicarboxylate transport system substrate-binding protein|nr:MAG: hypothetical protein CVV38_01135 [Candidatus Peregrinibacteria bacterium HGW-Peregrinibacteria-1]